MLPRVEGGRAAAQNTWRPGGRWFFVFVPPPPIWGISILDSLEDSSCVPTLLQLLTPPHPASPHFHPTPPHPKICVLELTDGNKGDGPECWVGWADILG